MSRDEVLELYEKIKDLQKNGDDKKVVEMMNATISEWCTQSFWEGYDAGGRHPDDD